MRGYFSMKFGYDWIVSKSGDITPQRHARHALLLCLLHSIPYLQIFFMFYILRRKRPRNAQNDGEDDDLYGNLSGFLEDNGNGADGNGEDAATAG